MSNIPEENTQGEEQAKPAPASVTASSFDGSDVHDSPEDEEKMKGETEFVIDMPDVSDIPGQEHVHVPRLEQFADTTIASDDEEGEGLFYEDTDDEDTELVMGTESDVDPAEKRALRTASEDVLSDDNAALRQASLDNRDDEGDLLNEGSSGTRISGKDLDMAGTDADDANEEIGEEDEENNEYSLGGDDNDEPGSEKF